MTSPHVERALGELRNLAATQRNLAHHARSRLARLKEEMDHRRGLFSNANAQLTEDIIEATAAVSMLEQAFREVAEDHYNGDPTRNKKPFSGVAIRVRTELDIRNTDAVEQWAKARRLFIIPEAVDFKRFAKFALGEGGLVEGLAPDAIRIIESPQVTIASNLGETRDDFPEQVVALTPTEN